MSSSMKEKLLSKEKMSVLLASDETREAAQKSLDALRSGCEEMSASKEDQKAQRKGIKQSFLDAIFEDIAEESESVREAMSNKPAQGLVIGAAGVGKSELIKQVFQKQSLVGEIGGSRAESGPEVGSGTVTTQKPKQWEVNGGQFKLWDCPGIESECEVPDGEDPGAFRRKRKALNTKSIQGIRAILAEARCKPKAEDHIHFIWYCVVGSATRFEDCEEKLLVDLAAEIPVIIVLTQCPSPDFDPPLLPYLERWREHTLRSPKMVPERIQIRKVLARDRIIQGSIGCPAFGLDELLSDTVRVVGLGHQMALVRAVQASRCITFCGVKAVAFNGVAILAALGVCLWKTDPREWLWKIATTLVGATFWAYGVEGFMTWMDCRKFACRRRGPVQCTLSAKLQLVDNETKAMLEKDPKNVFKAGTAAAMMFRLGKIARGVCKKLIEEGVPLDADTVESMLAKALAKSL